METVQTEEQDSALRLERPQFIKTTAQSSLGLAGLFIAARPVAVRSDGPCRRGPRSIPPRLFALYGPGEEEES
ncbi:hypothetical protein SKAU_G00158200 [Synaphobranchus kaupii]|uniref:Uncharacterized protein n=1 Tax=Synaphobranchus kaupii TaxID=118154 RepID=A0A9Q1IZH4_SYNKA|nr:hypothetical protein SKAU_G00158200 [Synaphobranchus kaupii]